MPHLIVYRIDITDDDRELVVLRVYNGAQPRSKYDRLRYGLTVDAALISGGYRMRSVTLISLLLGASLVAGSALAQQAAAPPPAYGEQINIEQAKKAAAAAVEEAKKINTFMAISVVSPSGDLVYFEKMDNTQFASINISIHKARAAATFRRPTLSFEERVAAGGAGITLLTLDGIIASPGGNPIIVGGKLIGAIGVSSGTGAQDHQVSLAGVAVLK